MKSDLFLAICIAVVVYVVSEHCRDDRDCYETVCSHNSSVVICEHDQCTCDIRVSCMDKNECDSLGRCKDHGQSYHCVDRTCTCIDDHGHHGPAHP